MIATGQKIKALIIFDTKDYQLVDGIEKGNVFKPVRKINNTLIESFRNEGGFSEIIYIYFRLKRGKSRPNALWFDSNEKVCYVPVNTGKYEKTGQIPTKWVQDIFIQTSFKEIYYPEERMNDGLKNALEKTAGEDLGICFKKGERNQPAGGNVQEVEIDNETCIITGYQKNRGKVRDSDLKLPEPFRHLPIRNVWNKNMQKFERPTHHLDMYFLWIGKTQKLPNCFIRSEVYFSRPLKGVFKRLRLNNAITDGINDGLGSLKVNVIELPAMLFDDPNQTGKHYYSMTYANAIVERYLDAGSIKVRLFLPNFKNTLTQLLLNESIPDKFQKRIAANIRLLFHFITQLFLSGPDDEKEYEEKELFKKWWKLLSSSREEFADRFIWKMQDMVLKRIHKADESIEVCFISNRFANYAEHYGGLHCLVKPIYG